MDLQSLEAFIAVAELSSFSRAGEKLFITQPAISKRIANLESQLGVKLFDRIGREVYLTEAGELLIPKAKRIIDDIKDVQTTVSQLATEDIRQLSMASSHHIGLHYLGPILRKFVDSYPLAQLDLKFMESEQAIESLLRRDIELALTTIPGLLHKDLVAQTLLKDELKFVVSNDHPTAQKKGAIRLNELSHATAILPDEQTTTYKIIEQTFLKHHIPLKRKLTVNYLESIRALVASGLGWSLLPLSMIDDSLTTIEVERVNLSRNLGVIMHRRRTTSRGANAFISIAEQSMKR